MTSTTTHLDPEQIDTFKRKGHLILPNFIDTTIIEQWRTQFWDNLGCSPTDPTHWPEQGGGFNPDPIMGKMPQLNTIIEQLGGDQFNGGGCGVQVRWPQQDSEWTTPESGHLDGYPGEGCQAVLMLGATTTLYDVEPGGGAFFYWPESHHIAHQYFLKHPDQIEGTFRDTPEWEERTWGMFSDQAPQPGREFTARAGDLILWHGWLCHSGSSNIRTMPRIGFFSRWVHHNDAEIRKDITQDMWKYWQI